MINISADMVRTLAARGEQPTLDYKREDYDWSSKAAANAELAKDLMAIANNLSAGMTGYILVGVENDGNIVGVRTRHLDDAALHQKIPGLLNRPPRFLYQAVDIDGLSVGVYTIEHAPRTFFPIRSSPPLEAHVALYRLGTSTAKASPDQIVDWWRADNSLEVKRQELQLQQLEADLALRATLDIDSPRADATKLHLVVTVRNLGARTIDVVRTRYQIIWTQTARSKLGEGGLPLGFTPYFEETVGKPNQSILPREQRHFEFEWDRVDALAQLVNAGGSIEGWRGEWFGVDVEYDLVNDVGRTFAYKSAWWGSP
jgi:hypothetical protein